MRIYKDFPEALNEIKRDISEMGIRIHPKTYQDKYVADDPDFGTLEIQDYMYKVLSPDTSQLNPTQPWANLEFNERRMGAEGRPVNPGDAWKSRSDVWQEFMEEDGRFAYSYSERFARNRQIARIVDQAQKDPDSRQLFLSMWDVKDTSYLGGVSRVPCTLGYQFQIRQGQLNMTYLQRSADFVTHFNNDLFMAASLQKYIAGKVGVPVGYYSHWIASLHMFRKDAKGVF